MDTHIVLVLGGSRSGKSEFAERLMQRSSAKRKGYIATSRILDDEMRYRVMLHKERRPSEWQTFEIMEEAGPSFSGVLEKADTLLFDCITMYVVNMLMKYLESHDEEVLSVEDLTTLQKALEKDLDLLFDTLGKSEGKEVIFVSDELGMGIVPDNAMSRVYRDLVGLANQYVAKRADEVYLSVAGITMEIKSRGVKL